MIDLNRHLRSYGKYKARALVDERSFLRNGVGNRILLCFCVLVPTAIAQLCLGADTFILLIAELAAAISCAQYIAFGPSILSLTPILFLVRYYGIAVLLKTLRGFSIQSNLINPQEAYLITAVILLCVSGASLIARVLTPRAGLISDPINDKTLIGMSRLMALIGVAGALFTNGNSENGGTGAAQQLGTLLQPLLYGAISIETMRNLQRTKNRHFFSTSLGAMLFAALCVALVNNARGLIVNSVVALALVLVLSRTFKLSYIALASLAAALFLGLLSPVILHTRSERSSHEGLGGFAQSVASTTTQAVVSPTYLSELHQEQQEKAAALAEKHNGSGNYLGNGNNVENRLAWVGLVDNIYTASQDGQKLGYSSIEEVLNRVKPRIIFPDKPIPRFGYSDYLSYQFGLESVGNAGSYNFGLPMEGYVSFGWTGLIIYTFAGVGIILLISTIVSPLSQFHILGVIIFVSIQTALFEETLDGFITVALKVIPSITLLYWLSIKVCERHKARKPLVKDGTSWRLPVDGR